MEDLVLEVGLRFVAYGEEAFPLGSAAKLWARLAPLHGLDVMRSTMADCVPPLFTEVFAELPGLLRREGIEAAVVDIAFALVEVVPISLDIPFVHIWNVMHAHPAGLMPSPFIPGVFDTTPEAQARNLADMQLVAETALPLIPMVLDFAKHSGLSIDWSVPDATTSNVAVISQTPRAFDFPVDDWPSTFHHTAPFLDDEGRIPVQSARTAGEVQVVATSG
jgi:zeaxanthin glucosyltransferase